MFARKSEDRTAWATALTFVELLLCTRLLVLATTISNLPAKTHLLSRVIKSPDHTRGATEPESELIWSRNLSSCFSRLLQNHCGSLCWGTCSVSQPPHRRIPLRCSSSTARGCPCAYSSRALSLLPGLRSLLSACDPPCYHASPEIWPSLSDSDPVTHQTSSHPFSLLGTLWVFVLASNCPFCYHFSSSFFFPLLGYALILWWWALYRM